MARFSKLGYLALNVADIARSSAFYVDEVGLQLSGTGPKGEVYLRCSDDHHNIVLYPGKTPGLERIGFELESDEELDRALEALRREGLKIDVVEAEECAALHQGPSYRFREPHTGARFEFYAKMGDFSGRPYEPTVAKIQRLGHLVLGTPDSKKAIEFFCRVLDFKISDQVGERTTFMRCFPNPFHHSMGIAHGAVRIFHHVNFMVTEIDDIGRALWRMTKKQIPIYYGPGRHIASGSVFFYFGDPDGMTVEYSYGMEKFPEHGARKPRYLEPIQENSDSWGGPRSKTPGVRLAPATQEAPQ